MPRRLHLRDRASSAGLARRLLLTAVAFALLVGGCTAGPSTRPVIVQHQDGQAPQQERPRTSGPMPLPPLQSSPENSINWQECGQQVRDRLGDRGVPDDLQFSCAGVITQSQSSSSPIAGIKRIHLVKVGNGPVPLAVLNDIDGAPGSLYAARLAARLPGELLDRFSLIGIDRRGSGLSDPINCIPDEVRAKLLGHDPTAESIGELVDAARSAGQKCAIALEGGQGAYDSRHTAGDLEQIRRALGVSHLNALARGEASRTLIAYAKHYPDTVGRFVLNGVPDPSPEVRTVFATIAQGSKAGLAAFDAQCDASQCPLGTDARTAVQQMAEQLRRTPAYSETGTQVGPGLALRAVRRGLGQPQRWPELAKAIAEATAGNPDRLLDFVEPLLRGGANNAPRLGATIATKCNDTTARLPIQQINTLMSKLEKEYPLFGGLAAQRLAWCSPWPPKDKPVALGSITDVPPILVTSSAADPVTPEQATRRAAGQLPTAVLLSWQGAGHGALRSGCVFDAVRGFLVDGDIPARGTLCPA